MRTIVYMILFALTLAVGSFASAMSRDSISSDSVSLLEYNRLIDEHYRYVERGKVPEALACISRALALQPHNPTNALLLANAAHLEQQRGNVQQALLAYDAALTRAPSNARIREARALYYIALDRVEDALSDYSCLVEQHPRNEVFRYRRAMIYAEVGRYASAEVDLEAIIASNDASLKAREGLAMVYTLTERYTEAERLYDYLISKLPDNPSVYEGRARLFLSSGKPGFALRDVNKAFELLDGKGTLALYRLRAEISTIIGDKKGATRDRQMAQSLSSDSANTTSR